MAKNFIAKAIKHPGALRATARREGLIHGDQKITRTILGKLAKGASTTTKRRIALAKTLMSMH